MRIALGLEYDGGSFHGWQSQADGGGVQDALERALGAVAGARVGVVAAGRTDAGAHATLQVVHFDTDAVRPDTAWVRGTNAHLPETIAVRWAMPVEAGIPRAFHRAPGATTPICCSIARCDPALLNGKVGWYHRPLAVEAMCAAAATLLGTP